MSEQDALLAEALLGEDAENFLKGDIGRYLMGRAEQEKEEALEQLARVLPWRRRKIQELQNRIWLATHFERWLADLIVNGRQAMSLLEDE